MNVSAVWSIPMGCIGVGQTPSAYVCSLQTYNQGVGGINHPVRKTDLKAGTIARSCLSLVVILAVAGCGNSDGNPSQSGTSVGGETNVGGTSTESRNASVGGGGRLEAVRCKYGCGFAPESEHVHSIAYRTMVRLRNSGWGGDRTRSVGQKGLGFLYRLVYGFVGTRTWECHD
jgi:hypothetical protein